MQKKFTQISIFILMVIGYRTYAQTEFSLISGDLVPHEEGFFRDGVTYDFNDDGLDETISGCPGEFDFEDFERRDPFNVTYDLHNESGEQQGFTYKNCMILSVCDAKYDSDLNPPLSHGYIQMRPGIDTSDVDLAYSYIESPEISNIVSITIETSPDVSIQTSRQIPYLIEYSKDGGETYDLDYYILDAVQSQEGYRVTYTPETNEIVEKMSSDSKTQNIKLRFITNPDSPELGAQKGQYVKVHKITIVADSAFTETPDLGPLSSDQLLKEDPVKIRNRVVFVDEGSLRVYHLSGRLIGKGSEVQVNRGLYVVVTDKGFRKKILIQ